MKTTIKTIENTISNIYKEVTIKKYYVEDEDTICQKIVLFGSYYNEEYQTSYFVGNIIGNECDKAQIMSSIEITDNKYEALYMFKVYL